MTLTPHELTRRCWFLTGPTASGKTATSLALAVRLNAEIISMDSMAVYRGLDIGTAKPNVEEQQQVPHHLIDIIEPEDEFSLADYIDHAGKAAAQIFSTGKEVLFVGGTPLYLKGLLRGIFEGPPADWDYRKQLTTAATNEAADYLHQQVAKVDPRSAEKLHPNDHRRLIRALEVYRLTGTPISVWQQQFEVATPPEQCRVFQLDWPRDQLKQRINQRVDQMLAVGWIEEVETLLASGKQLGRTAQQAVGYCEILQYFKGTLDYESLAERIKIRTHQFAKRQQTWFKSLSECRPIPMSAATSVSPLSEQILAAGEEVV